MFYAEQRNAYPSGAPDFTSGFYIVLSFFSPYFMYLSCLLDFDCSFCLITWYLYIFSLTHCTESILVCIVKKIPYEMMHILVLIFENSYLKMFFK